MSNGDESMSPAEFAKLMGAYPEPVGNPLPAYGGYMDNSPANFAWVQNNDYFGAEETLDTLIVLRQNAAKEEGLENWKNDSNAGMLSGEIQERIWKHKDFGAEVHLDGSPRIHGHTKCDCDRCERGREGFYPNGWTCQYTGVVYRYKDAETKMDDSGVYETTCDCGAKLQWTESGYTRQPDGSMLKHDLQVDGLDFPSAVFDHFEERLTIECPKCGDYHECEIEAPVYFDKFDVKFHADTDLTPTNHMNNSIGQVVPITNPMELPTNLIETEAGGGPEGQITPDTFEAEAETWTEDNVCLKCNSPFDGCSCERCPQCDEFWNDGWLNCDECFSCDDCCRESCPHLWDAETFEAPYGGAGSIMDIGKSTPLADFTDEELTTSSAIHGDFDQASLNYSGHQNLEVRAESDPPGFDRLAKCMSCGDRAVELEIDIPHCLSCGQQYDAEMEELTSSAVEVSNVLGEGVGRVMVEDNDEMDDDGTLTVTDDVDVRIEDMDGNILHEQTLDDSWTPYDDRDDYLESEMVETVKRHPIALLMGGLLGAAVILKPEVLQPVTNTISSVFESVKANFNSDTQEVLENDPELVENPDTGDLDPAQYEELVVESTGLALDVIPMSLDPSFMGSRFAALPTERYVEYNDPGIGAHTDIAMNRDEKFLEPEMAMVQAAEEGNEVKEAQAPGQSPYMSVDGQEPKDFNYRVIHETSPISLDPAVKPFIPQSMTGYTGNSNTPPSVMNKMFNIGVLGQTPLFVAGQGDMGSSHTGSRDATPNSLGIAGSVGGPLSDKVNANYTDGTTSMSLAQWAIENTVSQSSDTEAIVIDRSSGAMKRVRRV